MGVPSAPSPPTGSVGIGELLTDVETRALWLGVPGSIDATQSILVGDIVGLMQADVAAIATANAYTDTRINTRAPTVHTHTIDQITGLQASLTANAAVMPVGVVLLWHGLIADIPNNFALCDGTLGTPDLRDKFVMGAGGVFATLSTGGAKTKTGVTGNSGAHTHTGAADPTVLTANQLPQHTHPIVDPGHHHTITDPGHLHRISSGAGTSSGGNLTKQGGGGAGLFDSNTAITNILIDDADTGITVDVNTTTNSGHVHNVTIDLGGAHTHSWTVDVTPPYLVLAYIMKVA